MIGPLLISSLHVPSARDVFVQTMGHYGKLDSFSADLEHDGSSGLFSGKYTQHLAFKRGKGFSLLVTSHKGANRPESVPPDYISDGKDVMTKVRNEGVQPLNSDPNLSPGYEVSGGLIFTWLLDMPSKKMFLNPPAGMSMAIDWGTRKSWHSQKVDELLFKITSGERTLKVSAFLDPEHKHFVGIEADMSGRTGYMLYRNQKENAAVVIKSMK